MAGTSTTDIEDKKYCFQNVQHFPPVINGRINFIKFVESSLDLITIVESLGKAFTPVKYDMQGNIDKLKKNYKYNEESCLLELMLDEISNGKHIAAEGVLWLNRAFLFFELVFQEVVIYIEAEKYDISTKKIFTVAYEGSLKKYHNCVTQQLAVVVCKMSPSILQIMKCFGVCDFLDFKLRLTNFNIALHLVRCKIDDFFKDNQVSI